MVPRPSRPRSVLTDRRTLRKRNDPFMLRSSEKATPPLATLDLAVLLAAGLLLVLFRAHAFPAPLEADECNYLYIGERLNAGDRLYEDVWDHQPPLMFALAAVFTRLAGPGAAASRSRSAV